MKTSITSLFLGILIFLQSCGLAEKASNETSEGLAETIIEKATGMKADIANSGDIENQETKLDLDWEAGGIPDEQFTSTVTLSSDIISFNFQSDNLILALGLNRNDGSFSERPILASGDMSTSKGVSAVISIQNGEITESNFNNIMFMNREGEVKVTELSKDHLKIELDVKMADPANFENKQNWKTLKGTISCKKPLYNSIGEGIDRILQ